MLRVLVKFTCNGTKDYQSGRESLLMNILTFCDQCKLAEYCYNVFVIWLNRNLFFSVIWHFMINSGILPNLLYWFLSPENTETRKRFWKELWVWVHVSMCFLVSIKKHRCWYDLINSSINKACTQKEFSKMYYYTWLYSRSCPRLCSNSQLLHSELLKPCTLDTLSTFLDNFSRCWSTSRFKMFYVSYFMRQNPVLYGEKKKSHKVLNKQTVQNSVSMHSTLWDSS